MANDSKYLTGVKELTGKITEIGAKFAAKELRSTVKDALEEAEHVARARIPIGTEPHKTYKGRLVSPGFAVATLHIETFVNKAKGTAVALLGVAREAFYAVVFREFGTSTQDASPWLLPSFEQSKDPMLRRLAGSLRERVERIAKKKGRK
jgi:HK97 gp10 family phage protein